MAWLAVSKNGFELCFNECPSRNEDDSWEVDSGEWDFFDLDCVALPTGSIKLLTGKTLTWDDDPIKIE